MFTLFNSDLFKSQKWWGLMMWCWSVSSWRQLNQNTDITLLLRFCRSSQTCSLICEVERKLPRWFEPATHRLSNIWHSTLRQVPHWKLVGFEQNSSTLCRMDAFLLAETNESHVILTNGFQHLEVVSLTIYSDRIYPTLRDLWRDRFSYPQISSSNPPQNNSKLHNILAYFQRINKYKFKQMIKRAYISRRLQCIILLFILSRVLVTKKSKHVTVI
jgi:hypothetical protein